MLLGRLRISAKLTLLATIPLLAVALLTVPLAGGKVTAAGRAADTARTVRVAGAVGKLIRDVQLERLLSVGYLLGQVDRTDLVLQSAQVDDRLEDTRDDLGGDPPREVSQRMDSLSRIAGLRASILARTIGPEAVMAEITPMINGLIDALQLPAVADATSSIGRQVIALDATYRADEALDTGVLMSTIYISLPTQTSLGQYLASASLLLVYKARFAEFATPGQRALSARVDQASVGRDPHSYQTVPEQLIKLKQLIKAKHIVATSFASLLSFTSVGRFVETRIVVDIAATAAAQQRTALLGAYAAGGGAALIVLLVGLLTVAVARGVARPLIRLTGSAERIAAGAETELRQVADDEAEIVEPIALEPLDLSGRDEVGDLARAFDRVRSTSVQLVERQVAGRRNVATMFGHIGRRTQNLVGRQLALIDGLEREEVDPERLKSLYLLDHVSSRLNRNAGSLVVISGSSAASDQSAPQPIGNVVRLALGEIEDYTRVEVDVPEHLVVQPAIVTDLTLVLAELMENATSYSPPNTQVTVTAEASGAGVQILIVDRGIGMSFERLAEQNGRLTHRERLDLVPTEVLGLFVTGRLARRHGLGVTLAPTPGGGVTAVVSLSERHLVIQPAVPSRTVQAGEPGRAPSAPGTPGRVDGILALRLPEFDVAALERATMVISSGRSWDAFDAKPELEAAGAGGSPGSSWPEPGAPASWWEPPPEPGQPPATVRVEALPVDPAPARPAEPGRYPAAPGRYAAPPPAQRIPAPRVPEQAPVPPPQGIPTGLQRRVPGAQLPAGAAARHSGSRLGPSPVPADPAAARDLVEAFEAGVRDAQGDLGSAGTVPIRPPVAPPAAVRPGSWPGTSGLAHRVPGAALDDLARAEAGSLRTQAESPVVDDDTTREGRAR